jgi:hypothetical protein
VAEPLAADTSLEVEALQVERWRAMSPAEKALLVTGLTQAVFEVARAGVQHRHPSASEREVFLRLALVTLGPDLAREAYPEIASLEP